MFNLLRGISVLDGSFSLPLENDGLQLQGDPLWTARSLITNPEKVVEIHKRYLDAGAQIIETNSYQAAIPMLRTVFGENGQEKAKELIRGSVQLARQAIGEFCQRTGRRAEDFVVAGSIGPYGVVFHNGSEYSGNYIHTTPKEEIMAYYHGQVNALLEGGADIFAFETIPSLAEANLITEVLSQLPYPVFSWISFSCRDGTFTTGGDRFSDVVSGLCLNPSVTMIGINCTAPQHVTPLLKQGTHGMKSFVVYPNSGELWNSESGWHGDQNLNIAHYVPEWIGRGVKIIGGCCRIGPNEIKKIAEAVSNLSNPVNLSNLNLNSA